MEPESSRDLTRATLAILFVLALIVSSFWIMRPFLTAFLWATMLVISTWPVLIRLQTILSGKRGLATACMVIVLLLVLVIPLTVTVGALVANMGTIIGWVDSLDQRTMPPLPEWIANIPIAGHKIAEFWDRIASEGLMKQIVPYTDRILDKLVATVGSVGAMILQFLLTVIIAAFLYAKGEAAAAGVRAFFYRLAGRSGEKAAILAGNSIRGVAMGVVVTAITQTAISGIGLAIVSMPGTAVITAAVLVLCLAQIGPFLAMIPAVAWIYYSRGAVWGSTLLVFALIAGTVDNFLRPVLIRKGADLPLPLILLGVIGGLVGLGVMGIFIGPVILAVTYDLLKEWVSSGSKQEPAAEAASAGLRSRAEA